MQDSIQGPLLRSGHNSAFKALGETGFLSTVWLPNYGRPFVVWIRGTILHAIWQFRKTIKGG